MLEQAWQIAGALMIVAAFVSVQLGWLQPTAWPTLVLNFVGALILAVDAWYGRDWGFVLLELVWMGVSSYGIATRLRGRAVAVS